MNNTPDSKATNRVLNGETVTRRRRQPHAAVTQATTSGQSSGAVLPFFSCNCPPVDNGPCVPVDNYAAHDDCM